MKAIKNKNSSHKKTLVFSAVALSVLLTSGLVAYSQKIGLFSPDAITSEQSKTDTNLTAEEISDGEATIEQNKPPIDTDNEKPESTVAKKTVEVQITSGPTVSSNILSVRALVQELNSSGLCTLTLSKAGQVSVTKTVSLQPFASVSTCQGFTIPTKSLSKGSWSMTISYQSNTSQGSTTEEITL